MRDCTSNVPTPREGLWCARRFYTLMAWQELQRSLCDAISCMNSAANDSMMAKISRTRRNK